MTVIFYINFSFFIYKVCDSSCKTCSGPSETECTSCDETLNLILIKGQCVVCGNKRKGIKNCEDGNRANNDGFDS